MREKRPKKKNSNHKKNAPNARKLEQNFYASVYSYILSEYSANIASIFMNSPISTKIVDLVFQYYYGGNTVPNTAGDIADLIRSKYKEK